MLVYGRQADPMMHAGAGQGVQPMPFPTQPGGIQQAPLAGGGNIYQGLLQYAPMFKGRPQPVGIPAPVSGGGAAGAGVADFMARIRALRMANMLRRSLHPVPY